jgi:hypothetical protein
MIQVKSKGFLIHAQNRKPPSPEYFLQSGTLKL